MAQPSSQWLYVERLTSYVTEEYIYRYFSQWGEITEVGIPKDDYGQIMGHAFICFQGEMSVDAVQKWRPHYFDSRRILTRRMLPPYHKRTRTLTVDKADTALYIEGMSPVSTQDEIYARQSEIWSTCSQMPGTVTNVTVNQPVQDQGIWFGLATVHFADYDTVDLALMLEYLMIGGVCCTIRSRYQQQEHEESHPSRPSLGLLPSPIVPNNIPVPLQERPNISFGNPNQNLGAARKKIARARLRTQTSRPQKEEIDPIRGQIKRKRGATTGSIPSFNAKKQRLTVGLDQKKARERDGLVHNILQKVQLITNGPAMVAQLEEEIEALSQEQEEKKLKVAALKSVSPATKDAKSNTSVAFSTTVVLPSTMSPVKFEDTRTGRNDCISPAGSSIMGDETVSPLTRDKAPFITCHVCDAVVDIPARPTTPQDRSDVTNTVCVLQQSLQVLKRRRRELCQDIEDLKELLKLAEKDLVCPHCSKNRLASIKKCGHGSCQACANSKAYCRVCLVYSKEEIALVCGPGA